MEIGHHLPREVVVIALRLAVLYARHPVGRAALASTAFVFARLGVGLGDDRRDRIDRLRWLVGRRRGLLGWHPHRLR